MKKQVDVFVYARTDVWCVGELSIFGIEIGSQTGHYFLCKQTVELDIPDFDVVQIQVDGIEQQIVKLRAEFQSSLKKLEDRKAELLAIGHNTEEV